MKNPWNQGKRGLQCEDSLILPDDKKNGRPFGLPPSSLVTLLRIS